MSRVPRGWRPFSLKAQGAKKLTRKKFYDSLSLFKVNKKAVRNFWTHLLRSSYEVEEEEYVKSDSKVTLRALFLYLEWRVNAQQIEVVARATAEYFALTLSSTSNAVALLDQSHPDYSSYSTPASQRSSLSTSPAFFVLFSWKRPLHRSDWGDHVGKDIFPRPGSVPCIHDQALQLWRS